jgi:hypothetical protein
MLLRQPYLETAAFQKSRQPDIEGLLGDSEQRTGKVDGGHGML